MINEYYANRYCCDDISLIENYDKAINDKIQLWECHHIRETDENKTKQQLIDEGLYYSVPYTDLIFLRHDEHRSLHFKGRVSPTKGMHATKETRSKQRESHLGLNEWKFGNTNVKGRKYMNNGIQNIMVKPEEIQKYIELGWVLGRNLNVYL